VAPVSRRKAGAATMFMSPVDVMAATTAVTDAVSAINTFGQVLLAEDVS